MIGNKENEVMLVSTITGEIKIFSGSNAAHIFMISNKEYLVWSNS